MQIRNKIAIITGGANGIGAALARRLVLEGAQVVIGDIDEKSGQELTTELNQKLIDCWIKTIDTNLNAVIRGTQLGIQFLKKRGGGVIINTVEKLGFIPMDEAINAYIKIIQDDKLTGDTVMNPYKNNSQIISKTFVEDL
ncbi:10614_t:CDS:2, partial [Racocetra fulgida]